MVKALPDHEDEPVKCVCGKEIICGLVERKGTVFVYRFDPCPCGAAMPDLGHEPAVFGFEGAPLFSYRRR